MNQNRNEPCLCGSGKKYKKCCGLRATETRPVERPASPPSEQLYYHNHGPDIVATNFWRTKIAASGYFAISANARAMRVLLPKVHEHTIVEMRTAKEVLVSRGPSEMLELCFEDGSESPFLLITPARVCTPFLPRVGERFTVSVWTEGADGSPACQLRLPGRYRHVCKIPYNRGWEQEDETRSLY